MTIVTTLRFSSLALFCAASIGAAAPTPAKPSTAASKPRLTEPKLTIAQVKEEGPAVALTFDACMGKVDDRILDTLIDNRIPSTIFVTARWLKHNAAAFAVMRANPDLFEIEDHGENHVPAIDVPMTVFGIKTAGSPEAVAAEVEGGAEAIVAAGGERPVWFRGATAKYTPSAIAQIQSLGYRVAGYSINGDSGSLLGASGVERQYHRAKDGDVIISHINQPTHEAGEGVVKGILDLKARGFRFVRLKDRTEPASSKSF
ncbi:polysaccharide deacetylase family protein [Rhizobium wuzhouense]|uniref:Chitooligosaccharide deacetylase n=1 Tax=Rhizobium wuzhouense TaxID=1986026 RepID=A0ABX5NWJ3_9HYPH|nr:polysaccharide deacetylase family protein [Rhizobium wuzhouense]PYB77256.1 polysaccharide deacetylase [Rhizobium wuzhouense]